MSRGLTWILSIMVIHMGFLIIFIFRSCCLNHFWQFIVARFGGQFLADVKTSCFPLLLLSIMCIVGWYVCICCTVKPQLHIYKELRSCPHACSLCQVPVSLSPHFARPLSEVCLPSLQSLSGHCGPNSSTRPSKHRVFGPGKSTVLPSMRT